MNTPTPTNPTEASRARKDAIHAGILAGLRGDCNPNGGDYDKRICAALDRAVELLTRAAPSADVQAFSAAVDWIAKDPFFSAESLATSPQPAGAVDDAMVERAAVTLFARYVGSADGWSSTEHFVQGEYREQARAALEAARIGGVGEPVAWEHTLTVEGQPMPRLSYSKQHDFGRRGIDHGGTVTSRPLYATTQEPTR